VRLELKPIIRGMHVTHNGGSELSKTQTKFLGSIYAEGEGSQAKRGHVWFEKGRFAHSLLRPRNPHVSQLNGFRSGKQNKSRSRFVSL
jgi:hypothetical protein